MAKPGAIVVGVGAEAGLGAALCRRFARGGLHVLVAGRTDSRSLSTCGASAVSAAFSSAREAARRMVPVGKGTVLFTGASGSLRGRPGFAHFAAAKAGLRMIAQAMAREFSPQGIHVAHVVGIDGERLRSAVPDFVKAKGEDGQLVISSLIEELA